MRVHRRLSASSSPGTYAASINNRLSVPSYVNIEVSCVGDETGGTAYISVTAEQDLDTGVKLWSAILEDHEVATGSWGGYNGQEMMWIPVVAPPHFGNRAELHRTLSPDHRGAG